MRLAGKVALITGAALGSDGVRMGFGGTAAQRFAREGAKVVLTDVRDEAGDAAAAQISERYDGAAGFVHLDVTSEADWVRAIAFTLETFGRLDVLVNNAGTVAVMKVEDMPVEVWDEQLAVHAKGAFLGIKHAIAPMRAAGGGSIVNISSVMGIVGSPGSPAYSAAKGAIRLLTKSAAIQYAREHIRVNSVHPGYAETPMTDGPFADPKVRKAVLSRTPMGRLGKAEDIANGVLFLASDESSFMTGSELVIDGGMTAR